MTCRECNGEGFVRCGNGIDVCELCMLRARATWAGHEAELEKRARDEAVHEMRQRRVRRAA